MTKFYGISYLTIAKALKKIRVKVPTSKIGLKKGLIRNLSKMPKAILVRIATHHGHYVQGATKGQLLTVVKIGIRARSKTSTARKIIQRVAKGYRKRKTVKKTKKRVVKRKPDTRLSLPRKSKSVYDGETKKTKLLNYESFSNLMKKMNINQNTVIKNILDNRKGKVVGFTGHLISVRFQGDLINNYYNEETFKKFIKIA